LFVCGCASNTGTPAPSGACALVPNIDTLVGRTAIDRPASYNINDVDHCTWVYEADPSRYVGLSLGAISGHSGAIDSLGPGDAVANLGDDARWWPANHLLSFAVGSRSVQVDLELDEAESTRELAEQIGREAVANLR
jgi:hypothetical protein